VIDAVAQERLAKRIGHMSLTNELGERFWPVTTIESC